MGAGVASFPVAGEDGIFRYDFDELIEGNAGGAGAAVVKNLSWSMHIKSSLHARLSSASKMYSLFLDKRSFSKVQP